MPRSFLPPWTPALPALALALAFATGCAPAATTPPAADAFGQQALGADTTSPGAHVQVARQGQWYGATIVQPLGDGRFLVHYDNTGNEWNEPVGADRIKALPGAGPARDYKPGERVLVTYQGHLMVADIVMQSAADGWRVHYDGFGPEAGETVGADRLRRPFAGPSAHAVGEALMVEVNGQPLPAKVLALSAADRWVVRFDGFGPQYDQEIGEGRIKTAPPAPVVGVVPVAPPAPHAQDAAPPPLAPAKPAVEPAKLKGVAIALSGGPMPQVGPAAVGETVLVSVRGAWFPASVTAANAGAFKVKFAAGGEEDVPDARVIREPGPLNGARYVPGQLVLVEYKGVYVPGKVLKQDGKDYRVRFDGFGPEGDEVVVARRVRPR
jgi:hypothetical protein